MKIEFIPLTHSLYVSVDGNWRLQKTFNPKLKKSNWAILRRIKSNKGYLDEFRRFEFVENLDTGINRVTEIEEEDG